MHSSSALILYFADTCSRIDGVTWHVLAQVVACLALGSSGSSRRSVLGFAAFDDVMRMHENT